MIGKRDHRWGDWLWNFVAACFVVSFSGCAICCGPFDFSYPTYGGFYQRADRDWGRVGSIYSDPNYVPSGPSSDSNLESIDDSGFYGLPADESFGEPGSDNEGELPNPESNGGASPVPDDSTTSAEERKIWPVTFSNKNWR